MKHDLILQTVLLPPSPQPGSSTHSLETGSASPLLARCKDWSFPGDMEKIDAFDEVLEACRGIRELKVWDAGGAEGLQVRMWRVWQTRQGGLSDFKEMLSDFKEILSDFKEICRDEARLRRAAMNVIIFRLIFVCCHWQLVTHVTSRVCNESALAVLVLLEVNIESHSVAYFGFLVNLAWRLAAKLKFIYELKIVPHIYTVYYTAKNCSWKFKVVHWPHIPIPYFEKHLKRVLWPKDSLKPAANFAKPQRVQKLTLWLEIRT